MTSAVKKATALLYSSCCHHILIAFVGMTLLIVNYGVNTAQVSAEQQTNRDRIKSDCNSSRCVNNDAVPSLNHNRDDKSLLWMRNETISNLTRTVAPETPMISEKENTLAAGFNAFENSNRSGVNLSELGLIGLNFRSQRFLGLFGSNFSLSYNLTLSTGSSLGNITVISPAPAPTYYYYAPAPSYPYYPYYSYYDPNTYNPYASAPQYYYNPSTGYAYYG